MTNLSQSVTRATQLLSDGDLSNDAVVTELLNESYTRRRLDLSDLDPADKAALIAARATNLLPSAEALAEALGKAETEDRRLIVKFGIDPTSADVHLGHAVPMLVLSRFQRMGHQVVFIVGDITAKIGDPSGRSDERPPLTDADIAANLATYRDQVTPFFDFTRAQFRYNSEWLAELRLPDLIEILAKIPVSMPLQRDDFRERLAGGQGLALSEFIYSVVMAIDSAKIHADIELGGVDQLLNMQMGRKVMETGGQAPQQVIAMPLIEGTDGTGAKMSKSKGNYIPLTATPSDIFGKVMSIPDRLVEPYLRAWTEWTDPEIQVAADRIKTGTLHPMDLKKILAGEAVSVLQGIDAAMEARAGFTAQFSKHTFNAVHDLPEIDTLDHSARTLGDVLTSVLGFTPSLSAARRLAKQNGLRLISEDEASQQTAAPVTEAMLTQSLHDILTALPSLLERPATLYLKAGRKVARLQHDKDHQPTGD